MTTSRCANHSKENPCNASASAGHIFCDQCRKQTGGCAVRHFPFAGAGQNRNGFRSRARRTFTKEQYRQFKRPFPVSWPSTTNLAGIIING